MLNKAMLIGNVGQDPEIRYTPGGDAVANLSVATSEKWKDKQGDKQEKTEWHRIVAFGRRAEVIGEYVTKGSKLYIEGKLQTKKWQDQSGNNRYTTEIIADKIQMLGGNSDGGQQQRAPQQQRQQPAQQQESAPDFDDDIPF